MPKKVLSEVEIRNHALALEDDFLAGEYFRVIVLAPQLMVQVVELLATHTDEYLRRKGFLDLTTEEQTVQEQMRHLQRAESDRAQIAYAFESIFQHEQGRSSTACIDFVSAFSKLEALVSMRNRLAHDFYKSNASQRSIKASASGGIDLIRRLLLELENV
jgi:hypothetical protein